MEVKQLVTYIEKAWFITNEAKHIQSSEDLDIRTKNKEEWWDIYSL